jgi:hypothetical protein
MRPATFPLIALFVVLLSTTVLAQTETIVVNKPLEPITATSWTNDVQPNIIEARAQIESAAGARAIITSLLGGTSTRGAAATTAATASQIDNKDFYCMIHVLRWADANPQTVQAQNWYLYHNGELTHGSAENTLRIYGAKRITILYLHLNKESTNVYEPLYDIEVVKKTPAYLNRLLGLAGLFSSLTRAAGFTAAPKQFFATDTFDVKYRPSDITVTAKVQRAPGGPIQELGSTQKFDNEGKYFIDFSTGVPIRRISELNIDSTNNTVTAREVDKQNVFAFVNLHPRPIDIKRTGVNYVPHFVGGVSIARKPLDKIFVGAGVGPVFANFYIGALFNKQDELTTLQPGDPATPDQVQSNVRRRYKTQIGFGLNIPVGAIIEKLKD